MQIFSKTRFQQAYQMAMSRQAPKMYRELKQAGIIQEHLQEMAEQARCMYDGTVRHLMDEKGMSESEAGMIASEIVFSQMIEFPQ